MKDREILETKLKTHLYSFFCRLPLHYRIINIFYEDFHSFSRGEYVLKKVSSKGVEEFGSYRKITITAANHEEKACKRGCNGRKKGKNCINDFSAVLNNR